MHKLSRNLENLILSTALVMYIAHRNKFMGINLHRISEQLAYSDVRITFQAKCVTVM